jgi:hypothetical protein
MSHLLPSRGWLSSKRAGGSQIPAQMAPGTLPGWLLENAFCTSQKIEKLRQTTIASEIYQAIKRINRLNSQNAEVYFMNNDNEIIDIVISQFKNINVKEYKLEEEIKYKETKMDLYNKKRQENSYAVAFIKLLSTLEKGKYKKSLLREQIGYKNNNTFARDVLNKIEVAEYMSANSIVTKGQSVIVN